MQRLTAAAATKAELSTAVFDIAIASDLEQALLRIRPLVVVDCSGPFQTSDYRIPRAALGVGAHFVDLADARGYLLGFEKALDAEFRARDRVALSGASSSPALSAAAVDALTTGWIRVDSIDIAIVPGGQSEVGEAAVSAALSYCGRPVPIVSAGEVGHTTGWGEAKRIFIDGVGRRTVSPVETADAELLSARYPSATSIRFWAGLESVLEHQGLRLIAAMHRRGLLPSPQALAPLLQKGRRATRLMTGATGGMLVRVTGLDATQRWTQAEWLLVARGNCGPHVPPAPAAAAIRAILAGKEAPGARPALSLALADIEAELTGTATAIETRRETIRPERCLVQQAIGDMAFASLPEAVRDFHDLSSPLVWSGLADVERATSLVGRMVARVIGLPHAGLNLPVTVVNERRLPTAGRPPDETWTRCFATQCFSSMLSSPAPSFANERFGPLTFRIGLAERDGKLMFPVTGWRIGALPLPALFAPRSLASEWEDDAGRFRFDVRLSLPIVGLLAHYRGWLRPVTTIRPRG